MDLGRTTYDVLVTKQAERDLNSAADWIARDAPDTAQRWFNGFVESLLTLEQFPERCALAREDPAFPFPLRQLLYGRRRNYRALFTVHKTTVVVLSIRHASQPDLTPEDLEG